ncbi:MAG: hypothetical protein LBI99_09350 [Propionibacteriaceae bacterium]|jgi:hypothetical protein|nr:hypothetical protein [Propionibacteriaceae bacterium]
MAYQPWSVPLFLTFVVLGLALVVFATWHLRAGWRWSLISLAVIPLAFLGAFGWWMNQGGESDLGNELFLLTWAALVVVVLFLVAVSLVVLKVQGRRHG